MSIETKPCRTCGESKPLTDFHFHDKKRGKLSRQCKACFRIYYREWNRKNPDKERAGRVRYLLKHKDRIRESHLNAHLRRRFGLTLVQYEALLAAQGGCCAICRNEAHVQRRVGGVSSRLDVDHDHATGRVRGLLCHNCNIGLGLFRDDAANLVKAAEYLTASRLERSA